MNEHASDHPDNASRPMNRRAFLAGATIASVAAAGGAVYGQQRGRASANPADDVERRVEALRVGRFNSVLYVDVAEGPEAVQNAVDRADEHGRNKVIVYGGEAEWNKTVYLPDNFALEFLDGVKITSTMSAEDTQPFRLSDGNTGAALITNKDPENGNRNITVRGGFIDFGGVTDRSVIWAPVWLNKCENSLLERLHIVNVRRSYGPMLCDCRDSIMMDCIGGNCGYDGIAIRLACRRVDVYRCQSYNSGGPGIQAATFGRGRGAPQDVSFINCRTPESIFVHGYNNAGGARGILIHGCTSGRIAMIGEVLDFQVSNCKTTSLGFSSLRETIRNGRIDSVAFSDLDYGATTESAIRLRSTGGLIENITFSNCTGRTWGGIHRFGQTILSEGAAARYLDYTNCTFDAEGAEGEAVFFQHASEGDMSRLRIHNCKIWNVARAVEGPVNGVRIRDCELHNVGELHDGRLQDLVTRDNDDW